MVAGPQRSIVVFSMQLYIWVGALAVQESGQLGPEKLFIQPLFPPHATAMVAYPVSYLIDTGAMSLTYAPPADGTATAS